MSQAISLTNGVSITGFGSYLPSQRITEIPPLDEPISRERLERIGVHTRYRAGRGEGIAEMGARAAQRALEHSGVSAESIDLVILSNWTQRRYLPDTAPRIQQMIGASKAFSFDVCCSCAGFVVGLTLASTLMTSRRYRRALVVASETTSQRARPGSRATLIYSDGAGAAVLEAPARGSSAIRDVELRSIADQNDIMDITPDGYTRCHIEQRDLIKLAARSLVDVSRTVLERNGLSLTDIDWIIPHSGTAGVQATLKADLGISADRVLSNLPHVGNLSSAAIPVAAEHFIRQGKVKPGQTVLLASVGTGFYAGAALITV
ncbi:ketoacyl-ACP synthase III [Streptomyces sp. NPDC048419]|uniref:ketoacyl-ACP synthase III n=1 Tax=Streptomyces sp. NPDC048419 TaxID=3365547 RepID=UPI00371D80F1